MKDSFDEQYQKMTETPVNRLVLRLGLPTTVSMLITNLYNIVDTWFVGRLGTSATGAVGIVFGLMAVIQAFGFTFGHGSGSIISRLLGAQKKDEADRIASTGFFMSLGAGAVITVLGLAFRDPLCRLLGSTDTILPYARVYVMYILLAAPMLAASCVLNNILRYEGYAAMAMVGLVSGSVLNIGGDAFFMNVLHMGIGGAGLSTFLSQCVSFSILLYMFLSGRTQTKLSIRNITHDIHDVTDIAATGSPALIRQGLSGLSVMMLNGQAAPFGDEAIAAMSVVGRISNFIFSIAIGIGQGFQPVSSFNYGAGLYTRVRKSFWFTLYMSICMMLVFAGAGFAFSGEVVRTFLTDAAAAGIAESALKVQCLSLPLIPLCVCGNMMFQSIGYAGKSCLLSSYRSGLLFIPLIVILPRMIGQSGLIAAQPIADVLSAALSVPVVTRFMRRLPRTDKERG